MTENEIELFYNHYKNSISAINNAENRLLKCSYSFEKWAESLNEKSKIIREIYGKNEELIMKLVKIDLSSLNEATADKLITHIDFFMSEGYRDYQVVVTVLDVLIEFYKKQGPVDRLFDCYYFMASELIEVHEYEKACEYYRRALELYENPAECKEEYRRFKIMCCYYYRLVAAVCDKNASQVTVLTYYLTAMDAWVVNPIINFLTEKKKRGITDILNTLPCIAIEKAFLLEAEIKSDFFNIIENEYLTQKSIYENELYINTGIYVTYHKLRRARGIITKGEYNICICKKYNHEKENQKIYTYGKADFLELFDDEVSDEEFDVAKLCFMNPSYMYFNSLIPEMIEIFRRNDFIEEIEKYYTDFPVVSGNYLVDYMIEGHMRKLFKYTDDMDQVIRIFERVYMNRQIVTLIHSNMVCKLAEVITNRLINVMPEIFVGQFGINSRTGVLVNRDIILDFVGKAGKIHDIGKIMCADIINLQSRRISDREFLIIKKHPKKAADMIKFIPALSIFNDIVLGHHKSFDGKAGYPNDFDNVASPYKVFIDIIKICDCVDAATDFLGRNYAKAKDFRTVLKELSDGKGSTYSDVIVEAIENDEYLIKSIEKITKDERQHTYYEIYHEMIEPEINFSVEDELHIRHYEKTDFEKLADSERSIFEIEEIAATCDNKVFVVEDGKGNVFGSIGLQDSGNVLKIVDIYISKRHRKKGKGTALLQEIEKMAAKQGFEKITIPEVTEGHYDVFCWRNNYKKSDAKGIMEKIL